MRVGIVGGGITGLALHHYLSEAGVGSVLFEADAEPGGAIESVSLDGRTLELGPQRTRLSPPVDSLVDSLGIGCLVREANDRPLYVYRDGSLRRVPFTLREAVSTDLLSWRGKLRVLLEPLTGPPQGEETVEASIARMAGDEAAEYVVGPLYGGIYGSNPDEMPMEHSLLRALEKRGVSRSLLAAAARAKLRGPDPPPVVSFDGGMQTLPRALSEHHRDGVHLETPVEAVRDAGERFELAADGVTTVDEVVLTTPAAVTGDLLDAVAPEAADALRRLTYNPLVLVHVEPDERMNAAGFQVQYDESFHTLGVTCNADLFDRDDHYTCFLGGARTPELVDWSESAIRDTAAREFVDLTGVDASVLNVQRLPRGMPAYDTSWTAMDRVETPAGVHICANYASRAGVPGRVRRAKALAERLSAAAAATPDPLVAD